MILQRYINREILVTVLAVMSVLMLVYVSNRFVGILAQAVSGRISTALVFELLVLDTGRNIAVLIPLSIYVGVVLSMGRMYRDSEIVAINAGGVSLLDLARIVMRTAVFGLLITGAFSLFIGPYLADLHANTLSLAKGEAQLAGVVPGRFQPLGKGSVVYAERAGEDGHSMEKVFIRLLKPDKEELLLADRAYQSTDPRTGERYVILEHGHRYTGRPGRRDYLITRYARHAVRLEQITRAVSGSKLNTARTVDLFVGDQPERLAELQWRISLALSAFILTMLGLCLAKTSPREGRFGRLFVAVVVYFLYNNIVGIARNLVERGELSPWIGVWPVHLVAGGLAAYWLFNLRIRRRRRHRLSPAPSLS